MRFLLASTGLGTVAVIAAAPASAEHVISTAVTTPVATGTFNDTIRITSTGSVKPTSGAAVTVNSNNIVINQGAIAIKGANGATGILINPGLTADIVNSGTITIDEDFTPTDSDNDGDLDGPFAQGSSRFGMRVLAGGTYAGNIFNSGTINVEGNQSAGIAIDSVLAGTLTSSGKVNVLGNDSVGIRTAAVIDNVTIGAGSSTTATGANSVGVLVGGDVGGFVSIQGSISSTGYRNVTAPADPSKLDADDLLQGGSALVIGGKVSGGVTIDTAGKITTFGVAPAVVIGSASQDLTLGAVGSSSLGHGLVNRGSISGLGVYKGISATGLSLGGLGHAVNIAGGITNTGTIGAKADTASATAIKIGAGTVAPQIVNSGSILAQGGGVGNAVQAIAIDAGATVNAIFNGGTISATRDGTETGMTAAIVDHSGKVALVQNNGAIGVSNPDDAGAVAIDLHANTTGAVVRQIAAASGASAPLIQGNILLGSGNDTLDVQAGKVLGDVDFGGGTNTLSLTGSSLLRGALLNANGLTVTVGTGATLDATNLGAINLASLTTGAGANLGVTIAAGGHTQYKVAGAATFGADTKILVTLDRVGSAAGSYTIIDAGTLTGAGNLSDSIVTLPFLFNSQLTSDAANGTVKLDVALKGSDELGLNTSETAIIDAALDAADLDKPLAALFLSTDNAASLKSTLQQLMPEHAGGVFETATKGSRLTAGVLADPRPLKGWWVQQVAWGSSKSIGDTSGYDVDGWGASMGFDHSLGPIGSIGLTAAYLFGKDGRGANELISNHYEGGAYWRTSVGPFNAWARATIGTIDFESKRNFSAETDSGGITRTAEGNWKGHIYSASGGLSYEARMGRLSIRPNASIEYYKVNEGGYSETGGGDGLDLTVQGRKSKESAANAMLSLGYDLMGLEPDSTWLRVELEGGRREILSGSLGSTVAAFKDGDPFTLEAEQRTSGWGGGLRVLGGGSSMSVVGEVSAEEQQNKASLGARLGVSFEL